MISDEAVEAAVNELIDRLTANELGWVEADDPSDTVIDVRDFDMVAAMRAALEAAAPILLSHEREQTRLAHIDAVVNRDTVDRLERELETAKADAWDEAAASIIDEHGNPIHPTNIANPYRSQA